MGHAARSAWNLANIVPQGIWHTGKIRRPFVMLSVTLGVSSGFGKV